ncbi:uncharacterized protein LOC142163275 [Nicotiana tabacum]|uniref:Uncharacterized protein LOC142163275 n=1 Tax=Nicotiana tabacum TaxID=4097 RepID=A0AC58RV92_TOBAC
MLIDHNHPLYVGPSDTPSSVVVPVKLTGSKNYGLWSRSMWIALLGKKKLGFVTGTCKKDAYEGELLEHWETCNAIVLSWIMNNVAHELLGGVVYASDAHLVWENLCERFNKANCVRILQLHREIATLARGTSSVSVYFSKLKILWHEYDVLVPFPNCYEKSKDHVEHLHQQRVMQFLSGLNDSYDQARRQILMKTTTHSLSQTYAMIIQDESQQTIGANMITDKAEPLTMQAGRGRKQLL